MSDSKYPVRSALAAIAILLLNVSPTPGQPNRVSDDVGQADESAMVSGDSSTSDRGFPDQQLADPAFNHLVNLELLGRAWDDLDSSLMTDVALQFLEAERILLRPHKSISTDDLLLLATEIAGRQYDRRALQRLEKISEQHDRETLRKRLAHVKKLSGESRGEAARIVIPLGELNPEEYAALYELQLEVKRAQLRGDQPALDRLREIVNEMGELSEERKKYLEKIMGPGRSLETERVHADKHLLHLLDQLADDVRTVTTSRTGGGSGFDVGNTVHIP